MQCSTYTHPQTYTECPNEATHWLLHNGKRNPGGWVCEFHGRRVVTEYTRLASEFPEELAGWTLQPIDEWGRSIEVGVPMGE